MYILEIRNKNILKYELFLQLKSYEKLYSLARTAEAKSSAKSKGVLMMSIVGILMMVQYVPVPFIVVNLWPWAAPPPAGGGRQRSGLAKRDWSREMIKAVVVGDGEFSAQHLSPHFATCAPLVICY